jgi:hypothetical protein
MIMTTNKKITGRPKNTKETEIITIPTYNLQEYADIVQIPYSTLSKKKTGHTLIAVAIPNRKARFLSPEIAEVVRKHLTK